MEQGETNRTEKPDEIEEEKGMSTNGEKWVCDSSVDYKGRIPLRASTGVWRASLFIITIEFTERLSYFGIATNLISYLTSEIHQDIKTAAKNVNYWAGVTTLMPLVGGFLADAYTGRFTMVLLSSLIYLMGLSLLTMSQYIPSLSPCSHSDSCTKPRRIHEVIFFLALYCMSLGSGGLKPCLESFGADQFDDDHPQERKQKMSYFNWWNFVLCSGLVLGVTVIVYIQDHAGWGPGSLVLALIMATSIITFFMGRRFYRYKACEGSPLTPIAQVFAAAMRKRKLKLHPAVTDGRAPPFFETEDPKERLLHHTDRLRCLDKAAVMDEKDKVAPEGKRNPWRLATLTKVEETKLLLNMIPIWLTSLTFGVNVAHTSTFFVKQAQVMNRKVGDSDFQIPQASVYALSAVGMIISVTFYEKFLVPTLRRSTGNERGLSILQRIGIGLVFSVIAMAVAAIVETKRLRSAKLGIVPSVFWLSPQFIILGLGDGFTLVGLQEYFYDQVPDSMRSLGIAVYLSVIGGGSFLSSFLIIIVDRATGDLGGKSWFGKDLNRSRLDYFYWLLTAMNGLNLCVYVLVARRYTYKSVQRRVMVADCQKGEQIEMVA